MAGKAPLPSGRTPGSIACALRTGESVSHDLAEGRGLWLQLITGSLTDGETTLQPGDAASTESAGTVRFTASEDSEALLFDLA